MTNRLVGPTLVNCIENGIKVLLRGYMDMCKIDIKCGS